LCFYISGFPGVSYPKVIPHVLSEHVEKNKLHGKLQFNLFAPTGAEAEDVMASKQMFSRGTH